MDKKISRYERLTYIGKGGARDRTTEKIVAVKKINTGSHENAQDGIDRTAVREIKILKELEHANVIRLLDVFSHKLNISLVFELMETDMETIIKDTKIILTTDNVKAYMLMLLRGLEYLHLNWVLHRDLKPNNLLVSSNGCLKIADFGLAKVFGPTSCNHSQQVMTRWYRCPELLFGARQYATSVDIWAVGCILAELLLRVPFLQGESDLDQLTKIFKIFGTPNEETWPGLTSLPYFVQWKIFPVIPLSEIFTGAGSDLIGLAERLLALPPLSRCTASEALAMPYFSNEPAPTLESQLPMPTSLTEIVDREKPKLKRKLFHRFESGNSTKKLLF